MASIDERIVRMRFDNSQFASGVSHTQSLLSRLKSLLNFRGATQSLGELDAAGKRLNFSNIGQGLETVQAKFSALQVAGIAAFSAIGLKAVQAGAQMVKAISFGPMMQGFQEYETQMGAIQTILANTQHEGTNLKDVNSALDELNTYSDKTIYNFTEMAKNIGTFTAAGVSLDTSTAAIKGIANLAALSGSNSQQASTAMYQLSQAMAAGKATLVDWNSVVNAGMGGKVFQDALIETAKNQGVAIDGIIEKNGSFRDSLQEGWLTTDVLTETLSKFTGDLSREQLASMGYTEKQIDGIVKMGKTASDAATKVKTMSQLFSTLQEGMASGWAQTWRTIFGDFEEAKELFTSVSDVLGGLIGESANARNTMFKDWKELGGRTAIINAISNAFKALMAILKPIGEAFREIFPRTTGAQLAGISKQIEAFTRGLTISAETADKVKRTFKGVFAIFDIAKMVIFGVIGVIFELIGAVTGGAGSFLDITAGIGDFLVGLRDAIKNGGLLIPIFSTLNKVARGVGAVLKFVGGLISEVFSSITNMDGGGFTGFLDRLRERFSGLGDIGGVVAKVWDRVGDAFRKVGEFLEPVTTKLGEFFSRIPDMIADAMGSMNFDGFLDILNTGLFAGIALAISKFLKGGLNIDLGGGVLDSISDAFDGLTDTLGAMQAKIKADALIKIAGAVALLTASVIGLSLIDSGKLTSALVALGVMITQLGIAGQAIGSFGTMWGGLKLGVIATGMIILATAVGILSIAVGNLAGLDWGGLAKGLTGVAVLLGAISVAGVILSKNSGGLITAGIGMIAVAAAIKILASAVGDFAELDFGAMIQGLIGVGAVLTGLAIFIRIASVSKGALASSVGLIALGAALKIMASAVGDFASMDVQKLQQGLLALGAVLTGLAAFTLVTANAGSVLRTAAAMVVMAAAVNILATAVGSFGNIPWEELGRGLVGMAGALTIIGVSMLLMPPNMLLTAAALVVVAAALKIVAGVLQTMAGMSWDEIGRGFTVLGGSLLILAVGVTAMSGALVGAAAMIVVAGALRLLAPALVMMGQMTWGEIARGLTMLAAALTIFGVAGILLAPVSPILIAVGVAVALLGVGMLGVAAALTAFAVALTVTAAAGAAASAIIIATVAGLLGLIPLAFRKVGEGIIELANIIGRGGPAITRAFTAIIQSLLNAVNQLAPQIIATLQNLMNRLITAAVQTVPRMVQAGMQILLGLLQGINSRIGQVVQVAMQIMINFINAISSQLPALAQAGANLVVSFVNSVAGAIRSNSGAMNAAGRNLADAIIQGMVSGIAGGLGSVISAAQNMARSAYEAAKAALKSKSPSKVFIQLGKDVDRGFVIGVQKEQGNVENATRNLGEAAIYTMKDTLAGLSTAMATDMDFDPTIRPVLDLTEFKANAAEMNGMVPHSMDVKGSYSKAATLVAQARQGVGVISETGTPAAGQNITYIQNNNSPKAISPAEVYRGTKNQLSTLKKGALVK